MISVLD